MFLYSILRCYFTYLNAFLSIFCVMLFVNKLFDRKIKWRRPIVKSVHKQPGEKMCLASDMPQAAHSVRYCTVLGTK